MIRHFYSNDEGIIIDNMQWSAIDSKKDKAYRDSFKRLDLSRETLSKMFESDKLAFIQSAQFYNLVIVASIATMRRKVNKGHIHNMLDSDLLLESAHEAYMEVYSDLSLLGYLDYNDFAKHLSKAINRALNNMINRNGVGSVVYNYGYDKKTHKITRLTNFGAYSSEQLHNIINYESEKHFNTSNSIKVKADDIEILNYIAKKITPKQRKHFISTLKKMHTGDKLSGSERQFLYECRKNFKD